MLLGFPLSLACGQILYIVTLGRGEAHALSWLSRAAEAAVKIYDGFLLFGFVGVAGFVIDASAVIIVRAIRLAFSGAARHPTSWRRRNLVARLRHDLRWLGPAAPCQVGAVPPSATGRTRSSSIGSPRRKRICKITAGA
jgi:hypothetical protein